MKIHIKKIIQIFIIVILFFLFVVHDSETSAKKIVLCNSFSGHFDHYKDDVSIYVSPQKEAQNLFDSDRVKYGYLDKNHDGIACNNLLKTYVR